MTYVALGLVILFIGAIIALLPTHDYHCQECGYHTPDRQDAAGHQYLGTLHKML